MFVVFLLKINTGIEARRAQEQKTSPEILHGGGGGDRGGFLCLGVMVAKDEGL